MFAKGSSLVYRTSPHADAFQKRLLSKDRVCHACTEGLQRQQDLKYASCCWLSLPANWHLSEKHSQQTIMTHSESNADCNIPDEFKVTGYFGIVQQAVSMETGILIAIGFRELCSPVGVA